MVKSRRRKTCQEAIAAWLYDAYGMPKDKQEDFNWEAADLQRFMKAHGFDFHAITPIKERPPF